MLVDKASAAEFSVEAVSEDLVKVLLVMIETVSCWVIRASNVDECVEGLKKVGVPGSDDVSSGEAFGEAKHEAGEGLVAVEGPVVCAHARGETR